MKARKKGRDNKVCVRIFRRNIRIRYKKTNMYISKKDKNTNLSGSAVRLGHTVSSHGTVPGSSLESDEAVLSPAGAPGVLDQPVVLASLTAVT